MIYPISKVGSRTTPVEWPQPLLDPRSSGIEILNGSHAGRRLSLSKNEYILGRGHDADIRIAERGVSRLHAKLIRTPQGIVNLIDLGSKNGTAVNGRRIDFVILRRGDRIFLGPSVELRYGDVSTDRDREAQTQVAADLRERLTARQLQIAKLVAQGLSSQEVADLLELRVRSVESHLDRIYCRLDINTRAALTRLIMQAGLPG